MRHGDTPTSIPGRPAAAATIAPSLAFEVIDGYEHQSFRCGSCDQAVVGDGVVIHDTDAQRLRNGDFAVYHKGACDPGTKPWQPLDQLVVKLAIGTRVKPESLRRAADLIEAVAEATP